MSKFSPAQHVTDRLGDALLEHEKATLAPDAEMSAEEIAALPAEMFDRAAYNEQAAEKTGYSNYSYWGSTVRMFLKNRMAVVMLAIIVVMLVFTMIQPYLPAQRDPNYINNDPTTGMQIMNRAPCAEFWFGTNNIGQDLWARLWAWYAYQPADRLCRGADPRFGGRGDGPSVGLCASVGLFLHRALQHCG